MLDKTQKIKGKNISMKIFKTKPTELESHGFQVPANLQNLKKVELDEFLLTNNSKTKYVRLWGNTEKAHVFSISDFSDGLFFAEMDVIEMLTDEEFKDGVTYDCLVVKNKEFMQNQINDLSKKVSRKEVEKGNCLAR